MKETLTCTSCSKTWKREKARGRKPNLCPKCQKASIVQASQQPKVVERVKRNIKAKPLQVVATSNLPIEEDPKDNSEIKISIADVYRDYYPSPSDELIESTKNGSKWYCPSCGKKVRSEISLSAIPTHRCPEKSTNIKPFQRVD